SEEAVFTVQGVLTLKDLPPVLEKPRISAHWFKYLHQGITLSGLGTPTFDQAILAAQEVYSHFNRQFLEGILESWNDSPGNLSTIDMSNQYLTPSTEARGQESIPFFKGVDPQNILQNMTRGNTLNMYVHTEDNQVQYFVLCRGSKAQNDRFEECKPQQFRVGDFVQVQISFIVMTIKGGSCKMMTVLQSLALLDGS
ncbi:hypothetical protein L208DRAFT_1046777, partial [Tricholoma matsutake]